MGILEAPMCDHFDMGNRIILALHDRPQEECARCVLEERDRLRAEGDALDHARARIAVLEAKLKRWEGVGLLVEMAAQPIADAHRTGNIAALTVGYATREEWDALVERLDALKGGE